MEAREAMREAMRRIGKHPGTLLGTVILGLLLVEVGKADDAKPLDAPVLNSPKIDLRQSLVATSPASKPLNLLLTRVELQAIVRNYGIRTGEDLIAPIDEDEVVVLGPRELAPMRDVSQEVAGGIAAPFWAIMHPKDAWRIFVPVPPKGRPQESERPAPDPR
jgi:hypothetical protein